MYCVIALPIDLHGVQHLHRDRFDITQELGDPLCGARAHRRQRQGAIAEHDSRDAVLRRECAQRVPGDLRVVMAVIVDKPRRHHPAGGVDGFLGRAAQFADFDDLAVLDADIAAKHRHARAVDDAAVFDQQIVRHFHPFLGGCNRRRSSSRKLYHPAISA